MRNAYNDKKGITAKFNLNLLERMNRELKTNFIIKNFMHYEEYNPVSGAMESYLINTSTENQLIKTPLIGKDFIIKPWEVIHTEYSYKYLISDVESLAKDTGFEIVKNFFDKGILVKNKKNYLVTLWKVNKQT